MDGNLPGNRWVLLISERLGDVIFCTPAITWLKQQRPDANLSVVAPSTAAVGVLENNPLIDQIWLNPTKKHLQALNQGFDAVIDFHNSQLTREYGRIINLPTFTSPRYLPHKHQSSVALEFICDLLKIPTPISVSYSLFPNEVHTRKIEQLLIDHKVELNSEILVGCHMGCNQIVRKSWKLWQKRSEHHKSWSVENFIRVAENIRNHYPQVRFILTGSPAEAKLAYAFIKQIDKTIDLLGKTSVLELAALMQYCKVYLTGDTGPMHVACAMKIPLIALFGPTNPLETGPYPLQTHHFIIHKPKIQHIQPTEVTNALLKYLANAEYIRQTVAA